MPGPGRRFGAAAIAGGAEGVLRRSRRAKTVLAMPACITDQRPKLWREGPMVCETNRRTGVPLHCRRSSGLRSHEQYPGPAGVGFGVLARINVLDSRTWQRLYLCTIFMDFLTSEDSMSRANIKQNLFWLSKWLAFILGCGALFAGAAQADKSQIQPAGAMGPSTRLDLNSGQVLLRIEGEKISISQGGSLFKELSLDDAPMATYFKELLRDATTANGEIAVPVGHIIVANGGSGANGTKSKHKKKTQQKEPPTNSPPAQK